MTVYMHKSIANTLDITPVAAITGGSIVFQTIAGTPTAIFYTRDAPAGELAAPTVDHQRLSVDKASAATAYVVGDDVLIDAVTQTADAGVRAGYCAEDSPAGNPRVSFRLNA